jgi:site-specific recombinase XerD
VTLTMKSVTMSSNAVTRPGYHLGRTPANKGLTYPPEILTPHEAVALLRACSTVAPTGLRNGALIAVMYRGGLRLGEALALLSKDIDQERGMLSVLHGKGDRHRVVGLDPGAMAIVGRWADRRMVLGLNGRAPFFCTLDGAPLKPSYVRTLLPRLASRAGIEKRVHPHGLRHTHAFELMIEGVPVSVIQKQLGHASLATTDRYLRHVAPTDVIVAMQERTWSV